MRITSMNSWQKISQKSMCLMLAVLSSMLVKFTEKAASKYSKTWGWPGNHSHLGHHGHHGHDGHHAHHEYVHWLQKMFPITRALLVSPGLQTSVIISKNWSNILSECSYKLRHPIPVLQSKASLLWRILQTICIPCFSSLHILLSPG